MTNPTNKFYALLLAFFLLLNVSGFSQEVEKDKTFNLHQKTHVFYLNLGLVSGGSIYDLKSNSSYFLIDIFAANAGSQFYFNREDKKTKFGLDFEYFNYSFSYFLFDTGMSFSALRPGLIVSSNFNNQKSRGIDFKINGGAIVSALKHNAILGKDIMRNSYGWSLSSTLQFRTDRFVYGFFYQFADLDADQMAFHHRINFLFGLKL